MSASIPQMAFMVIFPLALLVVVGGWIVAIVAFVRRMRSGKNKEGNRPRRYYVPRRRRTRPQKAWVMALDALSHDGTHTIYPLS